MPEQNREVAAELERGRKALRSAQVLYRDALYEDALSRSYYAILHAAKAVLSAVGVGVDSHDAVKRLFGQHLVQTGRIERDFSVILREEQDDRLLADYDVTFRPDADLTETRVADAERFLERMVNFLRETGFPTDEQP